MEDLAKYPGLFRRGNKWYVRKAVPVDIMDQFSGDQIKKSLRTEDKQKAMMMYHQAMAVLESKFDTARQKKNNPHAHDLLSTFDKDQIIGLVYDWYTKTVELLADAESKDTKTYTDKDIQDVILEDSMTLQDYVDAMKKNDFEIIQPGVQNWLNSQDITYTVGSPSYTQFCHYFIQASIFLQEKSLAELQGKKFPKQQPDIFTKNVAHPVTSFTSNGFQPSKIIRFSELAERYINNDQNAGMREKSKQPYRVVSRRMKEHFGKDLPIHEINREMLENFRGALLKYPTHAQKKYPGKTMPQAIKTADKEKNVARLSTKTVNDQLVLINAMFNYAEKQDDWIKKNPARGLNLKDDIKDKEKRHPYTIKQLNKLFQTPLYTGCEDDEYGQNKPGPNHPRRHKFWIPLIALFTGMRLNEICQLEANDIEKIDGIDVFNIRIEGENEDKLLKTKASIRKTPIHDELKKIGFLEFVQQQRKKGHVALFPAIKKGAYDYKSHPISKWYGNFARHNGIYTPKTTFHSFRHSYTDAIRNANPDISESVIEALGGWSETQTTSKNYGSGYSIELLDKHLQKLSYKGLDLSHLYLKKAKDGHAKKNKAA